MKRSLLLISLLSNAILLIVCGSISYLWIDSLVTNSFTTADLYANAETIRVYEILLSRNLKGISKSEVVNILQEINHEYPEKRFLLIIEKDRVFFNTVCFHFKDDKLISIND
jgi:hypothetical protein